MLNALSLFVLPAIMSCSAEEKICSCSSASKSLWTDSLWATILSVRGLRLYGSSPVSSHGHLKIGCRCTTQCSFHQLWYLFLTVIREGEIEAGENIACADMDAILHN